MTAVSLVPFSEAAFDEWVPRLAAAYADDKVKAKHWQADGALERALSDMQRLLPDGVHTPGHRLWQIVAEAGSVGMVWVQVGEATKTAFLYNIEIDPKHQGQGYGTAALQMLETMLKDQDIRQLALHVFAHNPGAVRLYERLGYVVSSYNMVKPFT